MNNRRLMAVLAMLGLASGAFALWFFFLRAGKPDFDRVGGTILIYEIDPASIRDGQEPDFAVSMAEALQRRLNRNQLDFVVVLPALNNSVEIRIPRNDDDHAALVEVLKGLVSEAGGYLELRMLANGVDDKSAIDAAMAIINIADANPQLMAELQEAQKSGLPPPAPSNADSKAPKRFSIKLPGGTCMVTYGWVELGLQELQQLRLHNNAIQQGNSQAWDHLAARRNRVTQIPLFGGASDEKMLRGALFFSRECQDRNLTEEQRRQKNVDYFVLARNAEINPVTDKEIARLDGSYLVSAKSQPDGAGRPAAAFIFSPAGAKLLGDLSRKNIPSGSNSDMPMKRHLAIMLDGLVLSAPTINAEVGERAMMSGMFTNREVNQMVKALRAGTLPAKFKLQPLSQKEVAPKKTR
jgi:hypothetical protein